MTILIANENGDWWEHRDGDTVYVLDTDNLPEEERENWEKYSQMSESYIYEYGVAKPIL